MTPAIGEKLRAWWRPRATPGSDGRRWRRALATTVAGIGGQTVNVAANLISVPLTIGYLGAERYGVWMTVSAALMLVIYADLGLGSGVVNAVAHADGTDNRGAAREAVSTAFFLLTGIAVLLVAAGLLVSRWVNWDQVFSVRSAAARAEIGPTLLVLLLCFAAGLPLDLVQRIQMGLQEAYWNNLWQTVASLLRLAGLLVVVHLRAGLPWLALTTAGFPLLMLLANSLNVFLRRHAWLRPHWRFVRRRAAGSLLASGICFFAITLLFILGTALDNIIIAHRLDSAAVTRYSVVQRLFSLTLLTQFFTGSMWPAFSEAHASRSADWLRHAFSRICLISGGVTALLCIPMVVFGRPLAGLLSHGVVIPSVALLLGFAAYRMQGSISDGAQALFNTPPMLRLHVVLVGLASAAALALKLLLVGRYGVAGVIWAGAVGYGALYALPAWLLGRRWLRSFAVAPAPPASALVAKSA